MPRLTTHAIPLETVRKASGPLAREIADLLGIPEDIVTLEVRQDPFVRGGAVVAGDPFISVALFDRGPELEDRVARAVTRHFQAAGVSHLDVCLLRLERARYYEDGEPFAPPAHG